MKPSLRVLVCLAVCSCGGGGGGGDGGSDSGSSLVSAGADLDVEARTPVALAATGDPTVTAFAWTQTAGSVVALDGAATDTITFVAPAIASVLEFEVEGRRTDGTVAGTDRVVVDVEAARPSLSATLTGTIDVRGGGPDRASRVAVHEATERLFVVDSVAGDVVCYDVSNASNPSFAGAVLPPAPSLGYTPGPALAVACGDEGAVAITWSGQTTEYPGRIQFIDPVTLSSLGEFSTTGANPVDVAATPDGRTFAVACAGDPPFVGGGDGRAYVTLYDVPDDGPGTIDVHGDIAPIVLSRFDGDENALAQAGIRFFSNNPLASIELTPRAVTLSPDGSMAWASCPENDALVVIDVESRLVVDFVGLEDRDYRTYEGGIRASAERWVWSAAPPLVTTAAGDEVPIGGITGIGGVDALTGDRYAVSVVCGAGPSFGAFDRDTDGELDATLVEPQLELSLMRLVVSRDGAPLTVQGELPLRAGGLSIVGRANTLGTAPGLSGHDEPLVDLDGGTLTTSMNGARFGGATVGPSGDHWFADSRRCGVLRFSTAGQLLSRYVPEGTGGGLGTETLPMSYGRRRVNLAFDVGRRFGGFGGIAHHEGRGTIFAVTRLPLDNPDTAGDGVSEASRIARLVELDPTDGSVLSEYVVVLDAAGHACEGLAYSAGPVFGGSLVLLEAGPTRSSFRGFHRLELTGATNLTALSASDYAAIDAVLESTSPADLGSLQVPVTPVKKSRRVDLTALGLGGARPSGLVFDDAGDAIVTFDNGFGLDGASVSNNGRIVGADGGGGSIGVVRFERAGIDASRGSEFAPTNLPIFGLPQPTDLVAYDDDGASRVATANGGRPRFVPHPAGGTPFDDRATVGDLTLDTSVFPNASTLQLPAVAGELLVSTVGADTNGDMLVDRLEAFGARSVSVWDGAGARLWDSGGVLEDRAWALRADRLMSSPTAQGLAPTSVAVGDVEGGLVMASGLRAAGLVALHDLSNPTSPIIAALAGDFVDVIDVELFDVGRAYLVTVDRELGRVELRRLRYD